MLPHLNFHEAGYNFLGYRKWAIAFSAFLMIASIALLATRGLEFGIDFTGGTLVEVGYPEAVELDPIRQTLTDNGFGGASVQTFGTARDVLIRLPSLAEMSGEQADQERAEAELSNLVLNALRDGGPEGVELRRVEFVGPAVGEELREQGGLAVVYALIGILIYVAVRFEWRFSLGAVVALVHDVVITLGVFSLTGLEFDLGVLAAILAVIGYSLNDTIVVYDRIRENFRIQRKADTLTVMNDAINKTLSRTIITSLTTMLVLLSLALFAGATLFGFSLALIVGVVVGTYSSVFIAATAAYLLGVDRQVLMPVKREGVDQDDTP